MVIRRLNRGEAEKAMSEWIATYPQLPPIDGEYALLRNDLLILFQSVVKSAEDKGLAIKDYYVDSQFGIHLYMYLRKTSWFSLRLAADDGFWRYLSLKVIPSSCGGTSTFRGKPMRLLHERLSKALTVPQIPF